MNVARPLNPVLAREVKERLRTRRATIVMTLYLVVLSLLLWGIYQGATSMAARPVDEFAEPVATETARLGGIMFDSLVLAMLALVLFIVPGLTADAVTGERERQTLVPLQVTLLRPVGILAGKLLAALAFVALLVVATLPLIGVSFLVGGVAVTQVAKAIVAVLACGVVAGAVTLLCSSLTRRTQAASVLAYAAIAFLVLGSVAIYGLQTVLTDRGTQGREPAPTILALNPFVGTADFVAGTTEGAFLGNTTLLQGIADTVDRLGERDEIDDGVVVDENGVVEPIVPAGGRAAPDDDDVPTWVESAIALGAIGALSFFAATRRIRTPSDRSAAG